MEMLKLIVPVFVMETQSGMIVQEDVLQVH